MWPHTDLYQSPQDTRTAFNAWQQSAWQNKWSPTNQKPTLPFLKMSMDDLRDEVLSNLSEMSEDELHARYPHQAAMME